MRIFSALRHTCCSWYVLSAFLTLEIFGERIGRVLISPGVRALRSPTVLMFLARTSCPKPRGLQGKRMTIRNGCTQQENIFLLRLCVNFYYGPKCVTERYKYTSITSVLYSPHVGGNLRQHSLYRCRAANQGRVDTVFRNRPWLLAHFWYLGKRYDLGLHLLLHHDNL